MTKYLNRNIIQSPPVTIASFIVGELLGEFWVIILEQILEQILEETTNDWIKLFLFCTPISVLQTSVYKPT